MNDILTQARTILKITPQRWENLTAAVSPELLSRIPSPNEWSALDCLKHALETEKLVFPVRVKNLLDGVDFAAFDPDRQGSKSDKTLSPHELAEEFSAARKKSLVVFDRITPADLPRKVRHMELGLVSLSELLNEWAGHDLMHLVQAERAMMQPFIQGCGPWQPYFKDHIA